MAVTLICIRQFQAGFPELWAVYWPEKLLPACPAFLLLHSLDRDVWLLFWFVKGTTGTARYLAFVKRFIAAFEQTFLNGLWFEDKNVNSQVLLRWSPSWLQCWARATEKYCWCLKAGEVFARSRPGWGVLWETVFSLCPVFWQIATNSWGWMLLSAEK